MKSIGEEVTDRLINEEFPSREMKIEHLKSVSETIKQNEDLKTNLSKELSQNDLKESVDQKFEKTKKMLLTEMFNKSYNGFASIMVLSLITFLISGGSLFYILLINGYFG